VNLIFGIFSVIIPYLKKVVKYGIIRRVASGTLFYFFGRAKDENI